MTQNKYILLTLGILLVAMTRLLPHEYNYSPMAALALFAGSKFKNRYFKILVPLIALFLSDVILNNFFYKSLFPTFTLVYDGWYMVYASYILISFWGSIYIKNESLIDVIDSSLVATIIFFIVSNLSYFVAGNFYTKDLNGLVQCYAAAIPFVKYSFLGTLVWSVILFGCYQLSAIKYFKTANA